MPTNDTPRLSLPALKVLNALLEAPRDGLAGSQIGRATRVASGTVYPILARFERAGWVESRWEDVDPREAGRPRRRYYSLTSLGARRSAAALSELTHGEGRVVQGANLAWA